MVQNSQPDVSRSSQQEGSEEDGTLYPRVPDEVFDVEAEPSETTDEVPPSDEAPAEEEQTEPPAPGEEPVAGPAGPSAAEGLLERVTARLEAAERVSEGLVEILKQRVQSLEDVNRQLHRRVEDLSQDQTKTLLKPVYERLAALHTTAAGAAEESRTSAPSAAVDFEFIATAIEELLGLYDIDSVGAEPGQQFDATVHHAAQVKKTDDPGQDNVIHRVVRQGFTQIGAERTLLPARVSVYRYSAPAGQATESAPQYQP